jgi:hypothetical protein
MSQEEVEVGVEGFMVFLLESERMMGISGWALESVGSKGPISGAPKEKAKLWNGGIRFGVTEVWYNVYIRWRITILEHILKQTSPLWWKEEQH